jgi:hypothetical protein
VAVVLKHCARELPGNRHDCLLARLRLGQLCYASVTQIVKAHADHGIA